MIWPKPNRTKLPIVISDEQSEAVGVIFVVGVVAVVAGVAAEGGKNLSCILFSLRVVWVWVLCCSSRRRRRRATKVVWVVCLGCYDQRRRWTKVRLCVLVEEEEEQKWRDEEKGSVEWRMRNTKGNDLSGWPVL